MFLSTLSVSQNLSQRALVILLNREHPIHWKAACYVISLGTYIREISLAQIKCARAASPSSQAEIGPSPCFGRSIASQQLESLNKCNLARNIIQKGSAPIVEAKIPPQRRRTIVDREIEEEKDISFQKEILNKLNNRDQDKNNNNNNNNKGIYKA